MPGSGTDSTKPWIVGGPAVILVEPQLGENIGSAARAMGNFGLSRLRIVNPREGWPNEKARVFSAGADRILDGAELFPDLRAALAGTRYAFAATARERGMAKPVLGADAAAADTLARLSAGEDVALVFGRERTGLYTEEVSLCDAILTLPVNPAFASLNLATCVAVTGYEWSKAASAGALPFAPPDRSPLADKADLFAFFDHLEGALEEAGFFRSAEKQPSTTRNIRNIFHRLGLTKQDLATLHGAVAALVEGREGREARKAENNARAAEKAVERRARRERGD
ncbi:RNA methyltransferase [Xanthobacter tagetidis]|uniref:RNA methyltransferase n=1 Tax=Xanthobacter tagetidis TaxID=60216 RepID=A0A3L7AET4_9HYPH|nr:RNA methyltransferase [Xanthobacter tagetidis]MBB6306005.1 tRNA/rRNA methyltransferase [Xanthobacter tagetidis]RLP78515.1 RNA methyltransferase [Xanthobacter tagetidis]